MTNPPERNGVPKGWKLVAVATTLVLLLALLVAGGLLTLGWLAGGIIGVADRCAAHSHALSCSNQVINESISWLAIALPPVGLISGLVIGAIAGGRHIRRGRTGIRWAAGAWGIFLGSLILTYGVMNI
jgi:hypothetical protein